MSKIAIEGGYVYDPENGIDGDVKDIFIDDGKVVDDLDIRDAKVIDATGMVVMPGGVDIHSHIAGSKINIGRLLRPEDHRKDVVSKTRNTRSGVGYSCPSTFVAGYRYARLGYTTVMEAAMPPLGARHVHEELNDTPIFDKAAYPLFGNNHFTLKYVKEGDIDMLKAFIAWLLKVTKGYAVKIVNPGGVENWKWGRNVEGYEDTVDNFGVTPKEIVTSLAEANEELNLPHSIHLHCNNLGMPGNYETTLETMNSVRDIQPSPNRSTNMHVVHCQFNALAGDSWRTLKSGASEIADFVNDNSHVSLDMGQAIFTNTTTMTGDGPWQFRLWNLTGNKWVNSDVEMEAGAGVVPYTFRKNNPANVIQWAIGLELALSVHDPWRVFMTTDHPNGGPFVFYPKVISWLMSRKARTDAMLEMNKAVMRRTSLPNIYREYTFSELATVSRAATARVLGLEDKGHLGIGANGDVAIYDIDPEAWRPSEYQKLEKAMTKTAYTIKDGAIVVKDGEIMASPNGKTYWVDAEIPEDIEKELLSDVSAEFKKYYTINLNNYPVEGAYLPNQEIVKVRGEW